MTMTPAVSIEMLKAEEISKLTGRSRQIFDVLSLTTEGMTMGEVFEYLKTAEPGSMRGYNENLTSRANDLECVGLIVRCGKRTCGLSGTKATVWRQRVFTDEPTKPYATPAERLSTLITGLRNIMSEMPEGVRPILETMISKAQG